MNRRQKKFIGEVKKLVENAEQGKQLTFDEAKFLWKMLIIETTNSSQYRQLRKDYNKLYSEYELLANEYEMVCNRYRQLQSEVRPYIFR